MSNSTENAKSGGIKKDVFTIVTEKIIEQLEHGTVPWHKPWTNAGMPTNLISKKAYRGINLMLLSMLGYEQNFFLTFKQQQEIKGSVKKDEKPHMVAYWNFPDRKEDGEQPEQEERESKKAILRYYLVYNVSQCTGIDDKIPPVTVREAQPLVACDAIVSGMPNPPTIKHKEARAYYSPLADLVNMPKQSTFESDESYYATLFHELVHSTGHHSRLDRFGLIQMSEISDGKHAYSFEELIAEIGSSYLQCYAGISSQFEQSAAYVAGWLQVLKNDHRFVISASSAAQKAVDYILGAVGETEETLTVSE